MAEASADVANDNAKATTARQRGYKCRCRIGFPSQVPVRPDGKEAQRQQATLMKSVESRKAARIRRLVSNQYSDRWGFTAEDITNAILDCGSQFIALSVVPEDEVLEVTGKRATVSTRITFRGICFGGLSVDIIVYVF